VFDPAARVDTDIRDHDGGVSLSQMSHGKESKDRRCWNSYHLMGYNDKGKDN